MNKIAIFGSNGFIGSNLLKSIPNSIGITRENYYQNTYEHFDVFINAGGNGSKLLPDKDVSGCIESFEKNVIDLFNVLMNFKFDHFIHLSSCEVYKDYTKEDAVINSDISRYAMNKYLGERLVQQYCKKWIVLRLNGVVGDNLKKGVLFDLLNGDPLWVSKESKFQFIHTDFIAKFIKKITKWNQIYNLAGRDWIKIEDLMDRFGVVESPDSPVIEHNFDVSKANKLMKIPSSIESIKRIDLTSFRHKSHTSF